MAAVAGVLVELAPGWAIETGIQIFGAWDKLAILISIVVVLVVLGAVAGILERVRPPAGTIIVAVLGAIGLVAAFSRGDAHVGRPRDRRACRRDPRVRLLPRAWRPRTPVTAPVAAPAPTQAQEPLPLPLPPGVHVGGLRCLVARSLPGRAR